MASGGSDRDVEDALSKLLQICMVAEYQDEFEMLIKRVTEISESLLILLYISGLKLALQIEMFRAYPTTLREAFSLARITEACFEAIAEKEKEQILNKKTYTIISLQSELASREIKGSLDADEDIGVDKVSSAINGVFDIGESNVESMKVRSKFVEFSENKECVEEVVVGGGEARGVDKDELNSVISLLKDGGGEFDDSLDEINLGLSEEFVIRVLEGGRRVLCYVKGSGRRKKKKMEAVIQR
ncbi:hypothetical protein Tco_1018465 [Tanacetum coccineum]|uniref:Uncharacterized protein n=1 Tax=Tanacetum coccineum TaxID=301880 RepID=A0ABQ5FUK2_9ASTR